MNRLLFVAFSLFCLNLYPFYSVVSLKHTEGKGIGFNQGYSSIDYLGIQNWKAVEALIDLRGHVFNSGDFAGNGGLGIRGQTSRCSLLGVYGFYDFRQKHDRIAQQVSGGAEFLTPWIDFRCNGYLPVGNTVLKKTRQFTGFVGRGIQVKTHFSGAIPMAEFEVGVPVRPQIYFTAGPYYLFHNTDDRNLTKAGWGGKVHLDVDIGKYFSFGGGVSYDSVFDFGGTGFVSLNIPFGGKGRTMKKACQRPMRITPIRRNEIIPIESTVAVGPMTRGDDSESSLEIVFVSNVAPEGGDGSFESPFNSLAAAEEHSKPGDIIYVFPGDHTSHNLDTGISLQEGQILVSSGHDFTVDGVTIPALTPGDLPILTNVNPDEPIVTNPGANQGLLSDFFTLFNWVVGP